MQKFSEKRKIRKTLSPVVSPKKTTLIKAPTVRFTDKEENIFAKPDILIKPIAVTKKFDGLFRKSNVSLEPKRPSSKKKIPFNEKPINNNKQTFFTNKLSERVSLKKFEFNADGESKEKESGRGVVFNIEGLQSKTENRINLFESKRPKLEQVKMLEEKKEENEAPINILFRLTCILKAINLLRMQTFYRPLKYINDEQIELINDPSCYFNKKEKDIFLKQYTEKNVIKKHMYQFLSYLTYNYFFKTFFTNIKRFLERFIHYIPLIRPNQKGKLMFDLIILFIILSYFFIIPMQLSFDFYYDVEFELYTTEKGWSPMLTKAILVLPEAILILDSSLKMITGYYENGMIVMDRKKILFKYLLKNLIFDILSYTPILIQGFYRDVIIQLSMSYGVILKVMQLLVFCKLKRIHTMIQNLEEIIVLNGEHDYILSLVKVCWRIVFGAHVNACVWHAVAYYNNVDNITWLDYANLRGASWVVKYWNSLYWATSVMVTIGYGEKVSPQNNIELFIGVCILLVSALIFGFTLNSMKQIFDHMSKNENEFKENISVINELMKKEKIDFELQGRVRKYLEYIMDSEKNSEKQTELLNKLTANLKREVLVQSNSKFLFAIPLFSKNFSTSTIEDLSLFMKKLRFSPEEMVYNANDKDDCSLYIVTQGLIDHVFTSNREKKLLQSSKPGEIFGMTSFFTEEPRECSAISKNISIVFEIKKKDFLTILKKNSSDYEKFCEIKDEMKFYHNYESCNTRCSSCCKSTHLVESCPTIHFIPDRSFIIKRYNYSEDQQPNPEFMRKPRKKFNALAQIDQIDEALDKFWDENDEELEQSTVFGDFNDYGQQPSIEEIIPPPPLGILEEEAEGHESKLLTPAPMRNSNFLLTKGNDRKSSINFDLKSALSSKWGLEESNGNVEAKEEKEKDKTRSSQKLRKSKSNQRDTMQQSQKIPSLKEKFSIKDMTSSKFISKPVDLKESLFCVTELDNLNNFKHYFPHNNANNVIMNLKYNLDVVDSPKTTRRKRNYGRRATRNKTVIVHKDTIITNFEKKCSLQKTEN